MPRIRAILSQKPDILSCKFAKEVFFPVRIPVQHISRESLSGGLSVHELAIHDNMNVNLDKLIQRGDLPVVALG